MSYILIVIWMASAQSYNRADITWPNVAMQEFNTLEHCRAAGNALSVSSQGKLVYSCHPKGNK